MDEERLAAIEDAIRTLADALGQLCEKVDWHDQQLDEMNGEGIASRLKSIESDFGGMVSGLGGILADRKKARLTDLVGSHEGLKGYASKYAKTFKSDLVGDAVDNILAYLQQEGASEDGIPQVIDQIMSELKTRFDEEKAEGDNDIPEPTAMESAEHAPGGSEAMGKPKAVEIEVKTGDIPPELAAEARRFRGQRPA